MLEFSFAASVRCPAVIFELFSASLGIYILDLPRGRKGTLVQFAGFLGHGSIMGYSNRAVEKIVTRFNE